MKKSTHIKILITLVVIIVVVIGLHLVGNNILPALKNHMGM